MCCDIIWGEVFHIQYIFIKLKEKRGGIPLLKDPALNFQ